MRAIEDCGATHKEEAGRAGSSGTPPLARSGRPRDKSIFINDLGDDRANRRLGIRSTQGRAAGCLLLGEWPDRVALETVRPDRDKTSLRGDFDWVVR